jgi:pSer/pThr/pTyr-binding forkhead associated (FHA) protein
MSIYRLKGASGPVINQSHTLGARTLIGRADDCDLRIDQDGVAGRHAEIVDDGQGGLTLNHLADGFETVLNGEAVQSASLGSGDEIRIANCRFVLQAPGLRPQKVLTEAAVRPRRRFLPWLLVAALLAAAAAAAWYAGLLDFVQR